jgi:hypothetical protein
MRAAQAQAASGETLPQRLRGSYHRIIGEHHLDVPQLLKAANEIERLRGLLRDLLNDCDNWGCAPSDRYAEALEDTA